jgi:RimJ/RimL family protein N-acetyltransferase
MRHNFEIKGVRFRLRPVAISDVNFILELRCNPVLSKFLHKTSSDIQLQINWIEEYFNRAGDYYFIVEDIINFSQVGLIALYDIDESRENGEWGRWIIKPESFAAIECAWLIYEFAFEELMKKKVCCRTVALNEPVVSFHDSCGIASKKVLKSYFQIGGKEVDAIEHSLTSAEWRLIGPRIKNTAIRLSEKLAAKVDAK